ncbi:Amino Acid/Auxin Permease (AAAP) Family [Thraustotheca clavata]|uniref:Amino Acid/Auxin Permease (AAAP) Family n=1 Tax=Thraustotheca clavata TaxID=74557 RepID=A0A1W0A9S8_9STRA|nr:Amino Acid/Auxin Permease (AAAP) Family [Thraustotheca clavata]
MPFLTVEDMKMILSLFCCCCGVGSLGLAGNYASAGWAVATIAFMAMALINAYATWCLCHVLIVAPKDTLTLGDVGKWCFGRVGGAICLVFQCCLCAMYPIVYLVLGGTMLTILFPDTFSQTTWLLMMAITLLPVCLVPTMKEGAGMAFAGGLATILADGIAIYILITNMKDENPTGVSPPWPELSVLTVTNVFGNLAFAYGACMIIPSLQHEHTQPERMPKVSLVAQTFITIFFFLVATLGVFSSGCQTPTNLLFAISGSKLGFKAERGYVVLAFLFMQLHITIAFAVIFFPVFQILERLVLGMHKAPVPEEGKEVCDVETPGLENNSTTAYDNVNKDNKKNSYDEQLDAYKAPGAYMKASLVRIALIGVCVVIAVIWKDKLNALVDFIGASASATVNMIFPILFYLKTFWTTVSKFEKAGGILCMLIAAFLGIYVSIQTGKDLFTPTESNPEIVFPFCSEEYQRVMVVSLFCCCCGVGSLGLAGNYASAGYAVATIAFIFMAIVNTYATWCLCKVLVVAPKNTLTLGDLGNWCFGRIGGALCLLFQCLLCAMYPIVYLVLGGRLLTTLFPASFGSITWIILMAVTLLPVCLVPTMKEGAGMALAGGLATILADGIAIYLLITNMKDENPNGISPPWPDLSITTVTNVFGNLAFAYGACMIIPSLQHEHTQPERMPRVSLVAQGLITLFFFLVALLGVFSSGCQTPNNLLFAISGSNLGFTAERGYVVLAFLFMQLHITIAFAVIFFPVFQILERLILGMHKAPETRAIAADVETPAMDHVSTTAYDNVNKGDGEQAILDEYKAPGAYMKASLVRTGLIAVCVVIAVIWKDHLNALVDFVGASASAIVNMILPMVFYLKVFWSSVSIPEKVCSIFFILVACFLGIYVSIQTGKDLFTPTESDPAIIFPFCTDKFQRVVFTNSSYYH